MEPSFRTALTPYVAPLVKFTALASAEEMNTMKTLDGNVRGALA